MTQANKKRFCKIRGLYNKIDEKFIKKHIVLSIVLIFNVTTIFVALLFYRVLPMILNYAPGLVNNYDAKWTGISYKEQYISIIALALIAGTIFLLYNLRSINNWTKLLHSGKNDSKMMDNTYIQAIREKYFNLPHVTYIIQILFPIISSLLLFVVIKIQPILAIKTIIVSFSFFSLVAIISFVFMKNLFSDMLFHTFKGESHVGIRLGLKTKIFLQILPVLIVAILFTSMIGYSRLIDEKGNLLFTQYKKELSSLFRDVKTVKDISQLQVLLKKIKLEDSMDCSFIVTPEGRIITSNGSTLPKRFIRYLQDITPSYDGLVCDATRETQGSVITLSGVDGNWIVGVKYNVASQQAGGFFLVSFIALLLLNIFVLYYSSKSLSDDISLVARSLTEIAEGEYVDLDQKISVTSNDEIGDLVIAFNKIQEREKQHISSIEEKQNLLLEKERLASLGQLIGGIAHNLRTPIMSISGSIEALKDLSREYDESIDDPTVTKEDHHDIAREILNWLETMQPYCSYMSDLISAVREQAVQLNASMYKSFTLEELVKRIEILMNYELKKYNCFINIDLQADLKTEIAGELNNLVQVFNNLIVNAIQSYDDNGGTIDFKITKGEKNVDFVVRDYGKGIPKDVQLRLFKEMITTKGKYGTGLGLYMSSVNVKGRFAGNIQFESEEGKGTSFLISIPYKTPETREVF